MSLRAPRFAVDIAVAFQFLTRLPVPQVAFAPDGLARAVKFFPSGWPGDWIGRGAAGESAGASSWPPSLAPSSFCFTWYSSPDACTKTVSPMWPIAWAAGTPNSGWPFCATAASAAYGAAALVLSLLSRAVLLAGLPLEHFTAYLISAHVLCRWSTLPLSYYLPPARDSEGQGARIASLTSTASLIVGRSSLSPP